MGTTTHLHLQIIAKLHITKLYMINEDIKVALGWVDNPHTWVTLLHEGVQTIGLVLTKLAFLQ